MRYLNIFIFSFLLHQPVAAEGSSLQHFDADSAKLQKLFDSFETASKSSNWDSCITIATSAIDLAKSIGSSSKEAYANELKGTAIFNKGLILESIEFYQKSYQIRTAINNKKEMATSLNKIGRAYMNLANYPLALSYFIRGLEISEELKDSSNTALILYNIGVIYYHRKDFEKSLTYLNKSEVYAKKINFTRIVGNIHKTRGTVYTETKQFTEALNEYSLALAILKEEDDKATHAALLNNIGYMFFLQGEYNLALKNHFESLEIKKSSNNHRGIANSYHSIGETYLAMGNLPQALRYAKIALSSARELQLIKLEESSLKLLSDIHGRLGNYKEAYQALSNRFVMYDSIFNSESSRNLMQMELSYDFEKKLQQQENEQKLRESILIEESRRNQITKNSLIILICLFAVLVTLAAYSYIKIKKDNKLLLLQKVEMESQKEEMESQRDALAELNEELQKKTNEISEKRDEIVFQRDLVTMQKKEITDSILYAQRIQRAILPTKQAIERVFPESFVLYLPKNVVSGDFYWVSKIGKYRVAAVADCTGHGVPGGFMSMLGIAFLNEIVTKSNITNSSMVLDRLRDFIIESLHQTGDPMENFDGMDMSFCAINDETLEMDFAGANSSIFVSKNNIDENQKTLHHFIGDRMPVSNHIRMDSFTNTKIQLSQGDIIYMFTDGFHDQFGGDEGRKFNLRKLQNLFESLQSLPIDQQLLLVENTFSAWKGNHYQVDDVLVFGIRV